MKTNLGSQHRVCGGMPAIVDTCADTPNCEGYTLEANGKCGYLKSSAGRPQMYTQSNAFVVTPEADTYIEVRGGGVGPGAGGGGGGGGGSGRPGWTWGAGRGVR